ncbi:hypothetical protein ACFOMD_17370 [Sphingoaurantiacus capsulatus]|uniref:DUF3052 family protein n=1 Tax=Sphingoaurantiacus capsulatus TaxID=1771310 RepID=A0ABV7XDV5_9SPHN
MNAGCSGTPLGEKLGAKDGQRTWRLDMPASVAAEIDATPRLLKKAAKVDTDITEDVIRTVALPMGFVDVKVCAVDAVWSGLKPMIRKELR